MAEVVISNNNINAHTETVHKVISAPEDQPASHSKNSIKLWLLKVRVDDGESQTGIRRLVDENHAPKFSRHAIRSNYMDKSIEAKKRVIRMLFVVVAEFFICWAPLHMLNTLYLFNPEMVYSYVGSTGVSLVQLLAYVSSCSNPITYCFMNYKFRQAFISLFKYQSSCTRRGSIEPRLDTVVGPNNSDLSGNESTLYAGRASRSEVLVLEKEERV